MRKNIIGFIAFCFVVVMISGCIGIGMVTYKPKSINEESERLTKENLIEEKGKPDETGGDIYTKKIVYKDSFTLVGVIPYVSIGLPIGAPLVIPTGKVKKEYVIKNGKTYSTIETTLAVNCFYGLKFDRWQFYPEWQFGCDD